MRMTRVLFLELWCLILFAGADRVAAEESPGGTGTLMTGSEVFEARRCSSCHTAGTAQQSDKEPLGGYSISADPLYLGAELWNHARLMVELSGERRAAAYLDPWPMFQPGELRRLALYLREAAAGAEAQTPDTHDASAGSLLFEERCQSCHSFQGNGAGPDLAVQLKLVHTRADMAGLMWNHVRHMQETLRREGKSFPHLTGREMANIFSFLFSAIQERSMEEELLFPPAQR